MPRSSRIQTIREVFLHGMRCTDEGTGSWLRSESSQISREVHFGHERLTRIASEPGARHARTRPCQGADECVRGMQWPERRFDVPRGSRSWTEGPLAVASHSSDTGREVFTPDKPAQTTPAPRTPWVCHTTSHIMSRSVSTGGSGWRKGKAEIGVGQRCSGYRSLASFSRRLACSSVCSVCSEWSPT